MTTTPTPGDYLALCGAIRTWLDLHGSDDLPFNVRHIGFDVGGQLRDDENAICIVERDGRCTILIRGGRGPGAIRRSALHELMHASDLACWPWLDRETAEFRAEQFARLHA